MRTTLCDICAGNVWTTRNPTHRRARVKRYHDGIISAGGWWTRLDICDNCWQRFLDWLNEGAARKTAGKGGERG